jgi:hypothetical protein
VKLSELELVPDLLRSLDSDREARGWDIPAELFTVTAEIITDQAAAVSVSEFPGWNQLMGGLGHCFHALTVANRIISGLPIEDRPTPDGLLGLVLVDEAWMVKPPPGAPNPIGSLAVHPDRVEQRFAWLVAVDGSSRTIVRERGADTTADETQWSSGRLVEAMSALVATLQER